MIRFYEEDLNKKAFKLTGISEASIVNFIDFCHVVNTVGVDIMHDIYEGIWHYDMCEIILRFINEGYISLDKLNQLKTDFEYGEIEAGNKSPPITKERLEAQKLLMSASEMQCFVQHFGLMVGDYIPKVDPAWQFYLQIIRFIDLIYLPSYSDENLQELQETVHIMHSQYITTFNQKLKPKHHIVTHYPTLIRRYGPLYYISSMRYEAQHKILKNYCKNTSCRINLSLSLDRKIRYNFDSRLMSKIGFSDNICIGSSKYINLNYCDMLGRLQKSQRLERLLKENTKETTNVTINGSFEF